MPPRRRLILFALVGAAFVAVTRGLWVGELLFFHDAATIARPLMGAGMEALGRGDLPLWDAAVGMGTPHLQNPILATFYPLLWPLALAPTSVPLFDALVLAHLALAGVGMWRLGRAFGLGDVASALGAVSFTFSGALLTSSNYVYLLFGWTWVPWALAGLVAPALSARARVVSTAVPVAFVLLAGCPDAAVALAVFGLALGVARWPEPSRAELGWAAAGLGIGVAVGLLQWAPTLAFWPESERAEVALGAAEGLWSLHPARLLQLVVPGFFGRLTPVNGYWGQAFTDTLSDGTFFFPELYLGCAAIGLLPLALTGERRRVGRGLAVATGLFVVVSLGRHGLADVVPGVFRYPERWMFGATLGLAGMAAIALDALPSATTVARRAAGAVTGLLALTALVVLVGEESFAEWISQRSLVPNVEAARADQRLGAWLALGGAVLLGVTIARPAWRSLALVATVLQLTAAHWQTLWTAPDTLDAAAATVGERLGTPPLRVARHPQLDRVQLHAAEAGLWANWQRHHATLRGNLGRHHGILALHDETPARLAHPLAPETAFWSDPTSFGRVFGVDRVLVSASEPPDAVARALGHGLTATFGIRHIDLGVATPTEAPFAGGFCIGSYERVSTEVVRDGARGPLDRAVVESATELTPGPGGAAWPCTTVTHPSSASRRAELTTADRTLLVFQTAFARGWEARIDGETAPVLRAYGSLAAVVVPPGRHTVELEYVARGLGVGQLSAAAGLIALLAVIAFTPRRGRAAPS